MGVRKICDEKWVPRIVMKKWIGSWLFAVAVVRRVVPNDGTFAELRMGKGTGCQPCQPKAKEICC
jgi:hypothetical protein